MSYPVRASIALLAVHFAACASPVEYRITGDVTVLYPGAPVVLRGVQIGQIQSIRRSGDTAVVRLQLDDRSAAFRLGDSLATRFFGLRREAALEIVRVKPNGRLLHSNESIHLGPAAPPLPLPAPTRVLREPPSPNVFQFIPPGPPRPTPPSVQIVSLNVLSTTIVFL